MEGTKNPAQQGISRESVGYGRPPVHTQFRPGQSGNPTGATRGSRTLTARVQELFEKGEINGQPIKDGKQVADLVAEVILKKVLTGDSKLIDQVWNRLEGKVPDRLAGHDGGAVKVAHKIAFVEVVVPDGDGEHGDGDEGGERNGHGEPRELAAPHP